MFRVVRPIVVNSYLDPRISEILYPILYTDCAQRTGGRSHSNPCYTIVRDQVLEWPVAGQVVLSLYNVRCNIRWSRINPVYVSIFLIKDFDNPMIWMFVSPLTSGLRNKNNLLSSNFVNIFCLFLFNVIAQ